MVLVSQFSNQKSGTTFPIVPPYRRYHQQKTIEQYPCEFHKRAIPQLPYPPRNLVMAILLPLFLQVEQVVLTYSSTLSQPIIIDYSRTRPASVCLQDGGVSHPSNKRDRKTYLTRTTKLEGTLRTSLVQSSSNLEALRLSFARQGLFSVSV